MPGLQRLKDYFLIDERGSTIETEIRAGIVTFLTMSYILLVNPQILAQVRHCCYGCTSGGWWRVAAAVDDEGGDIVVAAAEQQPQ